MHGDDYVSSGTADSMDCFEKEFTKAYEIKTQKAGTGIGYKSEGKVPNRVLRCTDGAWEMEADPPPRRFRRGATWTQGRQGHRYPRAVGRGRGR